MCLCASAGSAVVCFVLSSSHFVFFWLTFCFLFSFSFVLLLCCAAISPIATTITQPYSIDADNRADGYVAAVFYTSTMVHFYSKQTGALNTTYSFDAGGAAVPSTARVVRFGCVTGEVLVRYSNGSASSNEIRVYNYLAVPPAHVRTIGHWGNAGGDGEIQHSLSVGLDCQEPALYVSTNDPPYYVQVSNSFLLCL